MTYAFTGARVVLEDRVVPSGWIELRGDSIAAVGHGSWPGAGPSIELVGRTITPGFVDLHAHGGRGESFNDPDADVSKAVRFHRSRGTTTMLASLVSRPVKELEKSLTSLAESVTSEHLAGIHLEGPFLAAAHCGAHDPRCLEPPRPATVDRLLDAGCGAVRMVTLAPELPGGIPAVRHLAAAGVLAAVGHTGADYATTKAAVDAGARIATHLFNCMPQVHHRDPGPVVALLDDDRVTVELISDGLHLAPELVDWILCSTREGRVCLVSDAIPAAGLPNGDYRLGGQRIRLADGAARLITNGALAGSCSTLAEGVRRSLTSGTDLHTAINAATITPSRLLGLGDRVGSIAPGKLANLVILDRDWKVERVIYRGSLLDICSTS